MTKKTFEEIRKFNLTVGEYFRADATKARENTKLGYAIKRVSEKEIEPILVEYRNEHAEKYYDEVTRTQVDNALTDKATGAILENAQGSERPYKYDKEGLLAVMKAERHFQEVTSKELLAEWDKKEFDITGYVATEIPEDLTDEQKEVFSGFVL